MKAMESMKVLNKDDEEEEAEEEGAGREGGRADEESRRVFESYTINGPTMEEVFMNVCQKARVEPS